MWYNMTDDERDKILEDIHKKTKKELDGFMNLESAKLRPFYSNAFNQEIDQYVSCTKKGVILMQHCILIWLIL